MPERTLIRDVNLKDGRFFAEGTPCKINWTGDTVCEVLAGGEAFRARVARLPKMVSGLDDPPTEEEIGLWSGDGVARSILGYDVEPDGFDEEGSPSWLLALRLL